jgi:hypothetical protein
MRSTVVKVIIVSAIIAAVLVAWSMYAGKKSVAPSSAS